MRWKSARFVPLKVVQAILAGRTLDENQWSVDGPSECLAPAGSPGPFRTAVRWSAAVDRLTGATERHATACLEFRPGSGLWTVASFAGEAARDRWQEPVKAAFRLLADTGFGGERSRGWGRSETPEFVEGSLPEMILPAIRETAAETAPPAPVEEAAGWQAEAPAPQVELAAEPAEAETSVEAPSEIAPLLVESEERTEAPPAIEPAGSGWQAEAPAPQDEPPLEDPAEPVVAQASVQAPSEIAPLLAESGEATEAVPESESPAAAGLTDESVCPTLPPEGAPGFTALAASTDEGPSEDPPTCGADASACQPESTTSELESPAPGSTDESVSPTLEEPAAEPAEAEAPVPAPLLAEPGEVAEVTAEPEAPAAAGLTDESVCLTLEEPAAEPAKTEAPAPPSRAPGYEMARPHWLLSLFTPAPADAVDWKRGDYVVLSRGGRVESPAGSGEIKKQIHMVAEGSVLFAVSAPRGLATDVAPDGFAHPVYRAGFAVAVPLPKGS